jgi:hypothetical protein
MFTLVAIILVGLCVFLFWKLKRSMGVERAPYPTVADVLDGPKSSPAKIVFNGREYDWVRDMHPDDRREYEMAISGMGSASSNSSGSSPDSIICDQVEPIPQYPPDPVESLRQLREMKYGGLITNEEYETKKAEILARM